MFFEESKIQMAFVRWMKENHGNVPMTCAPAVAKNARQGALNKKMGYCAGWPDIFIAFPSKGYYGLFIEFKIPSGLETLKQISLREKLNGLGYKSVVCRSCDEAIRVVGEYVNQNFIKKL